MPMNRELYPQNWDAIARKIKDDAGWRCEKCGRPCKRPDEIHTKFRDRLRETEWIAKLYEGGTVPRFGRFTLTVAHLDHNPGNCDRDNLKALCAPCHLQYDADHHGKNAARTRQKNKISPGQ
ncbi:MAG: hypothetical protein ACP5D7_20025, partial [Limnospira sp.]